MILWKTGVYGLFNTLNDYKATSLFSLSSLKKMKQVYSELLNNSSNLFYIGGGFILLYLYFIIAARKKGAKSMIAEATLLIVAGLILLIYLGLKQRINFRAVMAVLVPMMVSFVFCTKDIIFKENKNDGKWMRSASTIVMVLVIGLACLSVGTDITMNRANIKNQMKRTERMFDYAANNPENIYIYTIRPWSTQFLHMSFIQMQV